MANFEFKLPDIGEGVTEGEIVNWLVKEGDVVREDQEMVEVMTDKATVTIGAPKAGRVVRLGGAIGATVPVGQVLIVLDTAGGSSATAAPEQAKASAPAAATTPAPAPTSQSSSDGPAATAVGDIRESLPGMNVQRPKAAQPAPSTSSNGGYFSDKPLAAPATRKLAREMGIDLRKVPPTGPAERVTREDVENFAVRAKAPAPVRAMPSADIPIHSALTVVPGQEKPASQVRAPIAPPVQRQGDQRVPIRGLRKRIYENMARSKHTAAHFTYVDECEATELRALRERTKAHAEAAGVKLTFLPFIVKAVVAALQKMPQLNCLVDDSTQEMILKGNYDIGVAAATEAGLIVPVLRNADRLSILEIAQELDRLGQNARAGKSRVEDLGGSSFTITSLGKAGGLFATPIVNYPEVAILGVHEMKPKPVIKDDQIVKGHVMLLSLSFDHRIIDGHVGAAFAQEIIQLLEVPERLLLAMR